ncbi:MAG: hypothetical protein LW848_12980 [Hyphomonadaceae bacterium]|jgi:hypothetical protein|nr:hypothetical protein [Hyphomonadaceae bacterium]
MSPYSVRLKNAMLDAMEEAEMFGDLDASQRAEVMRWLNSLPEPTIAAIGRSFAKAAKEVAR